MNLLSCPCLHLFPKWLYHISLCSVSVTWLTKHIGSWYGGQQNIISKLADCILWLFYFHSGFSFLTSKFTKSFSTEQPFLPKNFKNTHTLQWMPPVSLPWWSTNQADLFCLSLQIVISSTGFGGFVVVFVFVIVFHYHKIFIILLKNKSTGTSHRISVSVLPVAKRDQSPSLLTNLHCKQSRTPLNLLP